MGNPFSPTSPTSHLAGLEFLATWRRNISDLVSGKGVTDGPDAVSAQSEFEAQRDPLRMSAKNLGFDGEYHPEVVLDTDEFDEHSLATLRRKVDQINLDTVVGLVTAWEEISTRNATSVDTFRKEMARATSPDVWAGVAAAAAARAVADYAVAGQRVTIAAALTANKLEELRTGLEPTKNLVPHPPEHRSGGADVHAVLTGRDWRDDDVAAANAKTEAVRVLETVYARVIHETDINVPMIPVPMVGEPSGVAAPILGSD